MYYKRFSKGLSNYVLVPETYNLSNHITDANCDYYESIYYYNQNDFGQWKTNKTLSGVKGKFTRRLVFDFDSPDNVELAKDQMVDFISELQLLGVPNNALRLSFSGKKGFGLEIHTDREFTPVEHKILCLTLGSKYSTCDKVIYDANRILRIVNTRHMGSGLYKIPLSAEQLSSLSIDEIKRQATSQSQDDDLIDSYVIFNFPQEWEKYLKKEEKPKLAVVQNNDTMPTLLPARVKVLGEARAALELGYFEKGERSNALMILCSSYRAQGISIEIAYRMLKGVVELQTARTGQEKFSNDELWTNIVSQIYSPNWKGGIYRYEDTPLLQEVTSRLGLRPPGVQEALEVFKIEDIGKTFRKFATNIETNTIKLGIKEIDDNIRITTSMLVGLVGAPAGGKTSAAFDILHNASNAGTKCMMFSMDMGAPLVFQRLIQKHTGIRSRELYEHYKTGDDKVEEFESQLAEHYKNVSFCFKSGLTVEDLREQLIKRQQEIGEPIKLVVVDYLETMTSSLVDTVSSHSYISQKLKDVANELECTVVLLLQPQKLVGGPADAILNYTKIKGSSAIQQACSVIISVWREGFNPKHPEDDRYISFAVLKNRMGSLGSWNFSWDGLRGAIRSMTDDELVCFNQLMSKKENEKAEEL